MEIRKDNWRDEFISYISHVTNDDYEFSKFDCAIFPLKVFEVISGIDLYSQYIGRYSTYRGGLRVLKGAGYLSVEDWLEQHFTEITIFEAQPGDIGIFIDDRGARIGCVVAGAHAHLISNIGVISTALTTLSKVYSIDSYEKDIGE